MLYAEKASTGEISAVWVINDSRVSGEKVYKRGGDGKIMVQHFVLTENRISCWFHGRLAEPDEKEIWEKRETFPKVYRSAASGKGYVGGHNTAISRGWVTTYPSPPADAIIWWDDTEEGRFTGYFPGILYLSLIQDEGTFRGGDEFVSADSDGGDLLLIELRDLKA